MNINVIGTIYDSEMPTVIVQKGLRGARGLLGEQGVPGDQGDSIVIRGQWVNGGTYSSLDAVTWRSSALDGVDSLYIQNSAFPAGVSTTEPQLDPARWAEVGLTSDEGLLGGVWKVVQTSHPFTKVGQPAALTASGYELANASVLNLYGIALVREVISDSEFILQSTGGIGNVEPSVSLEGGFTLGQLYYVSASAGFLTQLAPSVAEQFINAIYLHGAPEGVVLPWTPVLNNDVVKSIPSARTRYYYTAAALQTAFTGPDDFAQTPDYSNASSVECFQNGLNLQETVEYSHDSVATLTLVTGAALNDLLEIWVEEAIAISVVGRTKLDGLIFDGVSTDYPLNSGATTIDVTTQAEDLDVYLDGNPQEPDADYSVFDNGGQATISFTFAPEAQTGEWIVLTTE